MKKIFKNTVYGAKTQEFVQSIFLAIKYIYPSDEKLREWLEEENQERVTKKICWLIKRNWTTRQTNKEIPQKAS